MFCKGNMNYSLTLSREGRGTSLILSASSVTTQAVSKITAAENIPQLLYCCLLCSQSLKILGLDSTELGSSLT